MKQLFIDSMRSFVIVEARTEMALCVYPLVSSDDCKHDYLSLHQAIGQGMITISEVSQGGSVPELHVINRGKKHVLILDGEELKGAKQNRVLNSSVLIPPETDIIVPVSCTEQGRWSYASPNFQESGEAMPTSIRANKMESVSASLKLSGLHRANQREVWQDISEMQDRLKVASSTGALHDVYRNRDNELQNICDAFPIIENQCGIYVMINGVFAGMDMVSKPFVWSDLHQKIVRSYVIDTLDFPVNKFTPKPLDMSELTEMIENCEFRDFSSVGSGHDLRFENPALIGSALIFQDCVVHAAIYPRTAYDNHGSYHSPRNRSFR
ncbi:MAG: hypothetical protein Q8M98_00165 [Candidatus Cloacimonadaceae bacterium]|nr:hypothetical protein [Candidatus Cloacimonadaceae bacterium]MDP3113165.1 hypothetical protein [Candidatus Cloacimonadaceae bacterium]